MLEMSDKLTIVGRIYVKAPVNSNMMTTTVTVILMTPLYAFDMNVASSEEVASLT